MPAFTAEQASINNGSKVVQINSGESVANIRSGDFLVLAGFIVEINRAFVGVANEQLIELVKAWSHSTQSNQSCIVIPTTAEFKTVVAALNEANMLVNNNYKAMQDWQTKMGTVTFENKDGTTTTVTTLKQIEADNQAQMDAYHPYPWAMRKVEFEAIRAANKEKYAASGWVHTGKKLDSSYYVEINKGLYTGNISTGDFLDNLHLGATAESAVAIGDSKTNYSIVNIAGVLTKIEYLSILHTNIASNIKFPPAEDGTRTYDSATGISVKHASASIAFASETNTNKVVTERVDMWGVEEFLREINDADPFVYKNGLIQSQAASINGVNTVNDNIRPASYFAWYTGDNTSRGKGVNWQTANESQRIVIASDLENKIYFNDETGRFYQRCLRGRSFAGLGNGDWQIIDSTFNGQYLMYQTGVATQIRPQGFRDTEGTTVYTARRFGDWSHPSIKEDFGIFGAMKSSTAVDDGSGIDGECYFLVCDTVPRLNKGSYHPSLNNLGTAKTGVAGSGYLTWHHSLNDKLVTRADCFKPYDSEWGYFGGDIAKGISGTATGAGTGREDNRYYDAIYPEGQGGVCRDIRYKASGLKDIDFAEADLSIKDGTYRGTEKPPFSVPFVVGPNSITTYISLGETKPDWWNDKILGTGGVTDLGTSKMYIYNQTTGEKLFVWLSGYTTTSNIGWYLRTVKVEFASSTAANDNHGLVGGESLILQTTSDKSLSKFSVSGHYTHTDVIGDPANIFLCDDLKNGWIGGWCQDIPDGTSKNFKLTRPAQISQSYTSPYTLDNGVNWTATPRTIDLITNSIQNVAWAVGFVTAINYKAKAKLTHNSANSKIFGNLSGIGRVFVSSRARDETARGLAYSLIDKIATSQNISGVGTDHQYLPLEELQLGDGLDKLLGINQIIGQHGVISLATPQNNSPAFKALRYNIVENQQAFINYAYAELKHNGTDWGDDGKVHIADNQTTMLDENGNTVLVGTARCVEALGWIKNDK